MADDAAAMVTSRKAGKKIGWFSLSVLKTMGGGQTPKMMVMFPKLKSDVTGDWAAVWPLKVSTTEKFHDRTIGRNGNEKRGRRALPFRKYLSFLAIASRVTMRMPSPLRFSRPRSSLRISVFAFPFCVKQDPFESFGRDWDPTT